MDDDNIILHVLSKRKNRGKCVWRQKERHSHKRTNERALVGGLKSANFQRRIAWKQQLNSTRDKTSQNGTDDMRESTSLDRHEDQTRIEKYAQRFATSWDKLMMRLWNTQTWLKKESRLCCQVGSNPSHTSQDESHKRSREENMLWDKNDIRLHTELNDIVVAISCMEENGGKCHDAGAKQSKEINVEWEQKETNAQDRQ